MRRRFLLLIFFLVMTGIYIHTSAPSVTTGDSGEFITAAYTLSIPHAPSFPLFTLLGKAFIQIEPWGSIPLRCNYFSAICSALTLLFIWGITFRLSRNIILSLLVAAIFGFSRSFWLNSIVTEVFALNTLWISMILYFLFKPKGFILSFFLFCLGLGNHQILIFFIPVFMILVIIQRMYSPAVLLGVLGLTIYLILPIRSFKEPPLNWGQPTSWERFYRTVSRKDYGSLSLAIGETPARNVSNTLRQISRFARQLANELPWFILIPALAGLIIGCFKKSLQYGIFVLLFLLFGVGFYLLGNLPFDAMSDGIMGRFFIAPALLAVLGLIPISLLVKKWRIPILGLFLMAMFLLNVRDAQANRQAFLAWDYSNSMLRTLPPHSALFLDGGDDAFYSLATQQYVLGKRNDVEIHDRGGLIFKNPYGTDFRFLTPEEKKERRHLVEGQFLKTNPLYYATMDANVLPGIQMQYSGFLYEAGERNNIQMPWSIIILRDLYPEKITDYRTVALAVFFPYWEGQFLLDNNFIEPGLRFLWRAQVMGPTVTWLKTNLANIYSHRAFNYLQNGNLALSEKIYRQWLRFEPESPQPQTNLGVVLEKMGKESEAEEQYLEVMQKFPAESDAVYNLAVLSWKKSDWANVVKYLEEVLRRNPRHPQAHNYLEEARRRISKT